MKGTFIDLGWRKVPFIHHSKGSDLTPDRIAHPSACAMNGAFVDLKCTNAPFMVDGRATPEPSRDGLLALPPLLLGHVDDHAGDVVRAAVAVRQRDQLPGRLGPVLSGQQDLV